MSHITCTCRRRRAASLVGRVAVVSGKQVTVAAAAAAASWSPAARRRAAAGRPGRRLWVLLHCKPREASGAASLLVTLIQKMRNVHYEVILTSNDAPRRTNTATQSQHQVQLKPRPHSRPARMPAWRAVYWSRGLAEPSHQKNKVNEATTRAGATTKHRTRRRDRLPRDRWDVSRIALAAALPVRFSRGWRAER